VEIDRVGSSAGMAQLRRVVEVVEWAVGLAGCAYLLAYLAIALLRMTYPFDLEWLEGATADHVHRILTAQRIYGPPSLAFTPFLYPPLYYYVSAAVSVVTGMSLLPLRLVSLASSVGCFWLVYGLLARETGSRYVGLVATGMFAATYRIGGAWLDLARVDSLFLVLFLGAVYIVRFHASTRSWAAAGALLALSALTKQTALMLTMPLILYAAIVDWRRAVTFLVTFGGVFGLITLGLIVWQGSWYLYYTVGLPAHVNAAVGVGIVSRASLRVWRRDFFVAMPLASVLGVASLVVRSRLFTRATLFYVILAVGLVGSAWISRLHQGAYDNVVIPAYLAFAILLALAVNDVPELATGSGQLCLRMFMGVVCLAQFVALAYDPRLQIPTRRDVMLHQQLIQIMRQFDGEVYLADHGFFPILAGKSSHAQTRAIFDVDLSADAGTEGPLATELRTAIEQHRFGVIILDDPLSPSLQQEVERAYQPAGPSLEFEGPYTVTGHHAHPRLIYVPR
jgi:4-amino-4-deoxy-L-arabinose transferase-like glycosyltransferase